MFFRGTKFSNTGKEIILYLHEEDIDMGKTKKLDGGKPVGGGVTKPPIGKKGNTTGVSSDKGGQHGFMPSAEKFSGRIGGNTSGGASNSSSKGGQHSFMPKSFTK